MASSRSAAEVRAHYSNLTRDESGEYRANKYTQQLGTDPRPSLPPLPSLPASLPLDVLAAHLREEGALVLTGAVYAPLTLFLLIRLWDTQHGLMQQHGFGRIYDVKAETGADSTGRFDLGLNAVLYVNMLIASPLFTQTFWVPALYKLGVDVSAAQIASFQQVCWAITLSYCAIYGGHLLWCLANGHRLNPMKYGFLISSYFLWYYTAWHTNSVLVWGIAHRLIGVG